MKKQRTMPPRQCLEDHGGAKGEDGAAHSQWKTVH